MTNATTTHEDQMQPDYDAVVIGAGFGGLRALIELRERGLTAHAFEAGSDVGGTWYWNRYPGARTDSESWVYCFRCDPEIMAEWNWSERYPGQPEVERYLQHIADRLELRPMITFSTAMESAVYDEEANLWRVTTSDGTTTTGRYLITAVGLLATPLAPPFEGVEDFKGEVLMTARWPKERVDFTGKRVGLVGTGATGIQVVPLVAEEADRLTVFQRTPNFAIPARNYALDQMQRDAVKADYENIWATVDQQFFGFPMESKGRTVAGSSPEEVQRVFERYWEIGGFRFLFETFDDLLVDEASNKAAADFIRNKIRSIVEDPKTAELLSPRNHHFASKRPPLAHQYYETFNRENVSLVDVKDNAIARVTPTGVQLADGTEHELDVLIFATGFDAGTGSLIHRDVRGQGGRSIKEVWADGPQTHLGIAITGFPNMFMVSGPQTPFANIPPIIEKVVGTIGDILHHSHQVGADVVDVQQEAMDAWSEHLDVLLNASLLSKGAEVRSWFLGANVEGKPVKTLFHFGGVGLYFGTLAEVKENAWRGFTFEKRAQPVITA